MMPKYLGVDFVHVCSLKATSQFYSSTLTSLIFFLYSSSKKNLEFTSQALRKLKIVDIVRMMLDSHYLIKGKL